ncbi:MAG: hypothetical protein F6K21_26960 [Symploca sp. SIO2D2]|nr:hypothetical protein [Symploca sp. SIO2D2]
MIPYITGFIVFVVAYCLIYKKWASKGLIGKATCVWLSASLRPPTTALMVMLGFELVDPRSGRIQDPARVPAACLIALTMGLCLAAYSEIRRKAVQKKENERTGQSIAENFR